MHEFGIAWHALTSTWAIPASVVGVIWGIFGGALPGISPSIAMTLLLPFTYSQDPVTAVVLLGSVYIGAEYGGSIPAILINTPGTNSAAATTIDGYAMHLRGQGGLALGISLTSGLVGGLFGLLMLVVLTEPLANVALAFTPPAYFALGLLGLSVIASLSGNSLTKDLISGIAGLMIATVGTDHPEEFGHGSPEGVAAPECANNVVTDTALVPLLSLGIPGSNSAAVLLGGTEFFSGRHRIRHRFAGVRHATVGRSDSADGFRRGPGLHGRIELPSFFVALRQ